MVETSIEQWIFDGLALAVLFQQIIECLDRQGRSRSNVDAGRASKYPPAKPGALDMWPLKAAGPDLKPHLCGQRTKYYLGMPPQQPFNFFCDLWRTTTP